MPKLLRYVTFVLIVILISEVSLYLVISRGEAFLIMIPPLTALTTYLSVARYGKADGWIKASYRWLYETCLKNARRISPIVITLLACTIVFGVHLIKYWTNTRKNLQILLCEGGDINPRPNAFISVYDIRNKISFIEKTDEDGLALFSVRQNALPSISITLERKNILQNAKVVTIINLELPHTEVIDVKTIANDQWKAIESGETKLTLTKADKSQFIKPATGPSLSSLNASQKKWYQEYHSRWGLPTSKELVDSKPNAEIVVIRKGYVLGYDPSKKIPRWVAYFIENKKHAETTRRRATFSEDPLFSQYEQANDSDYQRSGFDRGHLVSLSDLSYLPEEDHNELSYYTSIVPQNPMLNRGIWRNIEDRGRELSVKTDGVWIIAGSVFTGKISDEIDLLKIGRDVYVPTHLFRILIIVSKEGLPQAESFLVPNTSLSSRVDPSDYITTIDRIERLTGLDFFPKLDDNYENLLESQMKIIKID